MKKKEAIKLLDEATDILNTFKEVKLAHKETGEKVTVVSELEARAMESALVTFMYFFDTKDNADTAEFVRRLLITYIYVKHQHGHLDIDLNDVEGVNV